MPDAPDWGSVAAEYAAARPGYPALALRLLAELGVGVPGQHIVDVGCGTGALSRDLAAAGAEVTGVEPDAGMLAAARSLGGRPHYLAGSAEETGLRPRTADVVTAAQCWHWFDRPRAAREARRLLRAGGVLAILHMDWVGPDAVLDLTTRVVRRHVPGASWFPPAPHADWFPDLRAAGFTDARSMSRECDLPFSVEGWVARIRASARIGAGMPPARADLVCDELAREVALLTTDATVSVPHRIWVLAAHAPDDERPSGSGPHGG